MRYPRGEKEESGEWRGRGGGVTRTPDGPSTKAELRIMIIIIIVVVQIITHRIH